MDVIIYHNPGCGTSRNTLAMIRNVDITKAGGDPIIAQAILGVKTEYRGRPSMRCTFGMARSRITLRRPWHRASGQQSLRGLYLK